MLNIRPATSSDAYLLKTLIYELAEYDKLAAETIITEEDVLRDGFGEHPKFRALIAEWKGQVADTLCFSSSIRRFQGRTGLFLEDIFVRPPLRKQGIGTACWPTLRISLGKKVTFACGGKFSTGTSRQLSSIGSWAPSS